ncbi:hypothetical protein HED22_06510 [Thalassospira sp. HF15]|uniref:hypothetical protein n=1 Tax=Thalassospira sp. HF15 TaxID=2722755 RepID=UPI00143122E4|nr:hypothetical protein [Thalassospira sp. HF15]NIY75292.1 hypothetical protein [Thalassospira sp. HF15]
MMKSSEGATSDLMRNWISSGGAASMIHGVPGSADAADPKLSALTQGSSYGSALEADIQAAANSSTWPYC